jgi:hypothetical protein
MSFERQKRIVPWVKRAQQLWGTASLKRRQAFTPQRQKQCTSRPLRSWDTLSLRALFRVYPRLHFARKRPKHRHAFFIAASPIGEQ